MGVVYQATELTIGKRAALKVLHPEAVGAPHTPSLLDEAKAVNAIRHPGIVDIYGFGTLPDGRRFLLMERLEGESLHTYLKRKGKLPWRQAVDLAVQVLDVLEAAHGAGFVHRDLKPGNVFLAQVGDKVVPKLLDFGLALPLGAKPPVAAGTPHYVAPEQARNAHVGPKADLYALGCVLFELITGQVPFDGVGAAAVVRQHLQAKRPKLRELVPEVPAELERLVLALMHPTEGRRPVSAAAVREQLRLMLVAPPPPPTWPWPVAVGFLVLVVTGVAWSVARALPADGAAPPAPPAKVDASDAQVAERLRGLSSDADPEGLVDRLLAAEQAFPGRAEWKGPRAALVKALQGRATQARDELDFAAARTTQKTLHRLDAQAASALEAPLRRAEHAHQFGMVKVGDVWVDEFEHPNQAGQPPTAGVDFAEAEALCQNAGKRLCTEQEWEQACSGALACAATKAAKTVMPSGTARGCGPGEGPADMVGNLAEWTSSAWREGVPQKVIRGGSFRQSAAKHSCTARDYALPGQGGGHIGFRCCL